MASDFSWEEFYAAWLAEYEDDSSLDTSSDSEATSSQTTSEETTSDDTTSEETTSEDTNLELATSEEPSIILASVQSGDGYYGANAITAGTTGTGDVTIDSGSYNVDRVSSGVPNYAAYAPTYGSVTLTGGTTSVVVQNGPYGLGRVGVGIYNPGGTGYLQILAGATLTSYGSGSPGYDPYGTGAGYDQVNVGRGAGSFGSITVDGAGSALLAEGPSGRFTIGRDGGEGELTISAGGYARTLSHSVGRDGGTGTLTIDGPGSLALVNASGGTYAEPTYSGFAGQSDFGRSGGTGHLNIVNGGELRVENIDGVTDDPFLRFGRDNNSYGYGSVSGAGSVINMVQTGPTGDDFGFFPSIVVGSGGRGILEASDDAQINVLGDQARITIAQGRGGAANTTTLQSQLLINSGADVLIDSQGYAGAALRIAGGPGTNGLVAVDGAGSTLTVTNDTDEPGDYATGRIDVGILGDGRLDVTNGGAVASESLRLGVGTYAGYTGDGVVNVLSGGTIMVTSSDAAPYSGVRIGMQPGSTGVLTIDGVGSALTSEGGSGRLQAGRYGTGDLNVTGGGLANAFFLDVGQKDGSVGRVSIDGPGSRILVSDAYGSFPAAPGAAGAARFGAEPGSYGYLSITNGGQLDVINDPAPGYDNPLLRFGRDNGSVGVGVIDGAGSTANIVQTGPVGDYYGNGAAMQVGLAGQGTVTVSNGAQVNILGDGAFLGVSDGRYTDGVPDTTAAQSQLHILSGADVLVDSQNYGSYTSGGLYRGSFVGIGRKRETDGLIVVDGAGSTLTVTTDSDDVGDYTAAQIFVGELGRGQLDVSNGGAVFANELEVGHSAATVDAGTGQTTATSSGYLANPDVAGYGVVNITGGADVSITTTDNTGYRGVRAGRASESTGIINVDGAGSTLTSEGGVGRIELGRYGNGELNLGNGGQAFGFFVEAGRSGGASGRISVDGIGSKLTISDAYGHFTGYGGAYLGEAGFLRLGRNDGSYGYLGISNGGLVEVINDPASGYDAPFVQLGRNYGAQGVVVIDGAGSELRIQQTGPQGDYYGTDGAGMSIGRGGQGDVEVRNGGTLQVLGSGAVLGVSTGSDGVSSGPSELRVLSGATVNVDSQGYGGFQQFPDGAGGYVEEFIGARVVIGGAAATDGRILVDGAGSTLTVTSSATPATDPAGVLIVGNEGTGQLDIANGGTVENLAANGATAIGKVAGSTGTATVSGAGSLLNAGALLLVGADFDNATASPLPAAGGTGTLTLAGGGEAMATEIVVGATGTVAGDGTLTGDVALIGGTLTPGASPGTITITGDLTVDADSTLLLEIDGFGAGEFDQVLVSGTADIDLAALDLQFPTSGTFAAGTTATLVSSSDLTIANLTRDNFLTQQFGAVPAEGPTTLGGNLQGFLLADTGPDLIVRTLGPDGANATGLVDFGAGVTDGVVVDTVNGFGTGTGGGFDAFALFGVSAILGTGGNDTIGMATTSSVSIDGRGGDDALTAGAGDDLIDGGPGTDTLTGNAGADRFVLMEGTGTDTVTDFEDGNDTIALAEGTSLADISITASGASDSEVMLASGDSLILLGIAPAQITEDDFVGLAPGSVIVGTEGDDTLTGTTGDDLISGEGGDDTIDGEAGDDTLDGGDDTDEVFGDTGDDVILGGSGPDFLIGSDGADIIVGGPGDDQMIGSGGADVFVFEDGSGDDIILDWEDGLDRLDFSGHSAANAIGDLTIAQDGSDTVISFGGDSVRLIFTPTSEIEASDLVF